jgi:hypothetical protein
MGFYLYCIRNVTDTPSAAQRPLLGIDGTNEVTTVAYKQLEAIVSTVDVKQFSSPAVAKRAKEDIEWIVVHARRHEDVIEGAMRANSAVIPMKFGAIFKTKDAIEAMLKTHYRSYRTILKRLQGKQEWALKVYIQEAELRALIVKKKKILRDKAKEIAALPQGLAYFAELELEKTVAEAALKEKERIGKKIFTTSKAHADRAVRTKVLPKDITAIDDPMIVNSAYLVENQKTKAFQRYAQSLKKTYPMCTIVVTGPWPAYHFV